MGLFCIFFFFPFPILVGQVGLSMWATIVRGYFVRGEFVHFFKVLTLQGSIVMVGFCVAIIIFYIS